MTINRNMLSKRSSVTLLWILLLCGTQASSQTVPQNAVTSYSGTSLSLAVFDKNGHPFTNPGDDVSGSPFFLPAWHYGTIRLHDSTGYTDIQLRLDLMSQIVHYQDLNKTEMVLPKGLIREILLRDSTARKGPQVYTFRCGYPPIDNQDATNFYLVVASGRLTLLESIRKVLVTTKNDLSGEEKKEFHEYDDYYVYQDGILQRLKKDKDAIISQIDGGHRDQVLAFAAKEKLNFKSIDDIGRLIAYYDGLGSP